MSINRTMKNIIGVTISNCTTIISGIIIGFLVPKILSVESYGMYKTFSLYATYIGFFSLGIIDGIVLDYGGFDYDQLDRKKFRSFFAWYVIVHVLFALVLFISGIFFVKNEYKFIVIMIGIDLIAVNITGYYQQISQFTQRYKEFSIRKVLQSVCNILIVLLMLCFYYKGIDVGYQFYVVALVLVNSLLTVWYVFTYRDISIGGSIGIKSTFFEICHLVIIGFPLLFANLCSTLILTLDRQFVNILFDNKTYAVYAFAYNMLALVTVATSAVATVLYPTLKRATKETMMDNYPNLVGTMIAFVFLANASYFPLCSFVNWFLPKYSASLVIFRIIFPGLAISSTITVVMHNYYKVLGENLRYFKKSVVVLVLSGVANIIAFWIFKTTASISIASIITMIVWFLYIEQYFVNEIGYDRKKNFGYMLIMMLSFYLISGIRNLVIAFGIYVLVYLIITTLFYKNFFLEMIKMLRKK